MSAASEVRSLSHGERAGVRGVRSIAKRNPSPGFGRGDPENGADTELGFYPAGVIVPSTSPKPTR
jgi:hypothetical protein